MRPNTWKSIESSPVTMKVYRSYRRLPDSVRGTARWLVTPRWRTVTSLVRTASEGRVMSGPFKGMSIDLSPVSNRNLLGYVLGTQELELHGIVRKIVTKGYRTIINVGAADGYYAVGLSRLMPQANVVAFEALDDMIPVVERTAKANGVAQQITVEGRCDHAKLKVTLDASKQPALILIDIEGGEFDLLALDRIPSLAGVDMLIETHDAYVPDCTSLLIERFKDTHDIEVITAQPRAIADFPKEKVGWISRLMPDLAVDMMNERRTGLQQWLFLTAKSRPDVA